MSPRQSVPLSVFVIRMPRKIYIKMIQSVQLFACQTVELIICSRLPPSRPNVSMSVFLNDILILSVIHFVCTVVLLGCPHDNGVCQPCGRNQSKEMNDEAKHTRACVKTHTRAPPPTPSPPQPHSIFHTHTHAHTRTHTHPCFLLRNCHSYVYIYTHCL